MTIKPLIVLDYDEANALVRFLEDLKAFAPGPEEFARRAKNAQAEFIVGELMYRVRLERSSDNLESLGL